MRHITSRVLLVQTRASPRCSGHEVCDSTVRSVAQLALDAGKRFARHGTRDRYDGAYEEGIDDLNRAALLFLRLTPTQLLYRACLQRRSRRLVRKPGMSAFLGVQPQVSRGHSAPCARSPLFCFLDGVSDGSFSDRGCGLCHSRCRTQQTTDSSTRVALCPSFWRDPLLLHPAPSRGVPSGGRQLVSLPRLGAVLRGPALAFSRIQRAVAEILTPSFRQSSCGWGSGVPISRSQRERCRVNEYSHRWVS